MTVSVSDIKGRVLTRAYATSAFCSTPSHYHAVSWLGIMHACPGAPTPAPAALTLARSKGAKTADRIGGVHLDNRV